MLFLEHPARVLQRFTSFERCFWEIKDFLSQILTSFPHLQPHINRTVLRHVFTAYNLSALLTHSENTLSTALFAFSSPLLPSPSWYPLNYRYYLELREKRVYLDETLEKVVSHCCHILGVAVLLKNPSQMLINTDIWTYGQIQWFYLGIPKLVTFVKL